MRRVRASFLLRGITLIGTVGVVVVIVIFSNTLGWNLWSITFVAGFWFLAIELGLLPLMIEFVLTRRAGASKVPITSIWFVDLDLETKRARHDFERATRKNPTIR